MDPDRQIRLLIPPFFFFASILMGTLLTDNSIRQWASSASGEQLVAAGGAIVASLLPVGFVISSVTHLLLRAVFLPTGHSFETNLSSDALLAMWPKLGTALPMERGRTFSAAITLDHELLSPGMHSWIRRTWNVFLISAQGCMALVLVHVLAYQLRLEQPTRWLMGSSFLFLVLALNAVLTWRRTMDMLEFQAFRQHTEGSSRCSGVAAANQPLQPTSGASPDTLE